MLVHSYTPDHMVSEVTQWLDTYSHDPKPPQDPIQIGDRAIVIQGPWRGYIGRIVRVALPTLWVDPLARHKSLKEDMIPWGSSELSCEDDTIGLSGLLAVSVDDTQIEPPPRLKISSQHGYNVTIGDLVEVVRGKYYGFTGTILNVNFHKASMDIRCKDLMVCVRVDRKSVV